MDFFAEAFQDPRVFVDAKPLDAGATNRMLRFNCQRCWGVACARGVERVVGVGITPSQLLEVSVEIVIATYIRIGRSGCLGLFFLG